MKHRDPGHRNPSHRDIAGRLLIPLAIAIAATGWLLWIRDEPSRQGGYCMNATVEIAGVLQRADQTGDGARGPLPPAERLLAQVPEVDALRFTVDTPPEVQDEVDQLVASQSPAAFAVIVEDYLSRCREA